MKNTTAPSHFKPTQSQQLAHTSIQTSKERRGKVAQVTSYGKTSVKIPVKAHGLRSIKDRAYPYVDPEYVQENFANKYSFKKTPTGRSPVHGFEHAHIVRGAEQNPSMHYLERAMVHAEPSGYKAHWGGEGVKKHMGGMPSPNVGGRLRLSGHTKAHQIGKRSLKSSGR